MTDASENQILMQAFDFTDDDLDANRAGTLTPRQIDALRRTRRSPLLRQSVSLMLSLVLFAFVMFWDTTLLCKGFLVFVFVVSVLYEGRTIWRLWIGVDRDCREKQVDSIEGNPHFPPSEITLPLGACHVTVEGVEFEISRSQQKALREVSTRHTGGEHPPLPGEEAGKARLYFAPCSRIPVSIEQVE
jgi:hypothetical protein